MSQTRVRTPDGAPVAGATVMLAPPGSSPLASRVTDLAGNTAWDELHPQPNVPYKLSIDHPGYTHFEDTYPNVYTDIEIELTPTGGGDGPVPHLSGLDSTRHRFITTAGTRPFLVMLSAFMLYNRYLRGEDIGPQLQQWSSWRPDNGWARFNCLRVFLMAKNIPERDLGWPAFKPQDYPDFVREWPFFEAQCNDSGFIVLPVAFPDNGYPDMMPNIVDQRAFHGQMSQVVRDLYQLTNEQEAHSENRVDVTQFAKPPVFSSTGYAGEGLHPFRWDWFDFHPVRRYPSHIKDQNLVDNPNYEAGTQGMLCENDRDKDEKTSGEIAGSSLGSALGTCHHTQAGKEARLYNDTEVSRARAFLNGMV